MEILDWKQKDKKKKNTMKRTMKTQESKWRTEENILSGTKYLKKMELQKHIERDARKCHEGSKYEKWKKKKKEKAPPP